jgi:hypothetical protein
MRFFQGIYHRTNKAILADHFHFPFIYDLELSLLAQVRFAPAQWPELTLADRLPAALIIIAELAGAGFEHGLFHGFEMGFRYVKY